MRRARAATCAIINLAATPGLGSVMMGYRVAGCGQLLLSLAGFFLLMDAMFRYINSVWQHQSGYAIPPVTYVWMVKWGTLLFIAGWAWSLITSVQMLRKAKLEPADAEPELPPLLNVPSSVTPAAPKPVRRSAARRALLINLLATPGLGSLMAKRFVSGTIQLVLGILGFSLILLWFVSEMSQLYSLVNLDAKPKPMNWLAWVGMSLFAVAWFWALATSVSILREAKEMEARAFLGEH